MLESKFGMKYKMPHVLVHIVDNSARSAGQEVVVADDPSMYATLVVSGFPIGEDNKLIHVTRSDILNVAYGLGNITASDIKKYGQTITYPNALIDQGAPIQLLRVTPEDATYAYSCITIEWRWSDEDNKFHVRYNTARLGNDRELQQYRNKDRLNAAIVKAVKSDNVAGEGDDVWVRRAFIVNISAGRGSAYNYFATAINQTLQAKRPASVRYLFQTIDTLKNTTVEQFYATLVNSDNALANLNRTNAIDSVHVTVGKRAPGSSVVVPFLNEDAVNELYQAYYAKYTEIMNNPDIEKTEYISNVYAALTKSTFDPIFGLYLYEGTGSDKLPFFQVDMRSADIPELLPGNIIYYDESEAQSGPTELDRIGAKLINLTTGIQSDPKGLDTMMIGDIWLTPSSYSNAANPTLYFIAAINQVTGSVTPIRTNQLIFTTEGFTPTPSTLTMMSNASTKAEWFDDVAKYLKNGLLKDGETVAWYDPTGLFGASEVNAALPVFRLFYVAAGCYERAKAGTLIASLNANADEWLKPYKMNSGDGNADYSFINWEASTVGDLVATSSESSAFKRPGATVIVTDPAMVAFGADAQPIYVNDQDGIKDTDPTEYDRYYVADRTSAKIFHVGTPDSKVSSITKDVTGTMFDCAQCNSSKSPAMHLKDGGSDGDNGLEIDLTGTHLAGTDISAVPAKLGFRAVGDDGNRKLIVLQVDKKKNTQGEVVANKFTLDVIQNANVSNAFVADLGASGKKFYIANYVREGYYHDGKFYTAAEGGEALPDDANSIYRTFPASSSEPAEYYTCAVDDTDPEHPVATYTKLTGDNAITDESQVMLWYSKSSSTGNWILYTVPADTDPVPGGVPFAITEDAFVQTLDSRSATKIHRYTVTGTIGSIFRVQELAVVVPANYYTDQYGADITTASGGIRLEDGSSGFFDNPEISSIAFKWEYSKLLVDAYRGEIDKKILSPMRCPAKFLFDGATNTIVGQTVLPTMKYTAADLIAASTVFTEDEKDEVLFNPSIVSKLNGNDSIDVKQAMYDLMIHRVYEGIPEDKRPVGPGSGLSLHLDSGFTDTSVATLINTSFMKRFDNPNASWDIGGYTSANDGVTYTFMKQIVDHLIAHCKGYSINKPYTGVYTKIAPTEYTSFFPDIDTSDWDYRELMYQSGGNSWTPDVNGNLMRNSQRTLMRGSDTSDLIQESNMRTLTQLIYLLENKLREKLFEYNDDSVLRTMQDEVNNMFSGWQGDRVDSLNIQFTRDTNPDDGRELVVCWVDVTFRGINLHIPVIVNVNQRAIATS